MTRSIKLYNNRIELDIDSAPSHVLEHFRSVLSYVDNDGLLHNLYASTNDGHTLVTNPGYALYMNPEYLDDLRTTNLKVPIDDIINDQEFIRTILDGITLRDDQVVTVSKMMINRSGICQLATGSGKTEIACAFFKYLSYKIGRYPNAIILVPTIDLVKQTISRYNKYGVDVSHYMTDRTISGIKITHPIGLVNDLKVDNECLSDLEVIVCDEGHHLSAETWKSILDHSKNSEYRLALSASIIDYDRVTCNNLNELSYNEILIVGATGRLLVNYPTSYYISKGILATPVVFRMDNKASEQLKGKRSRHSIYTGRPDYQLIIKNRLQSPDRAYIAVRSLVPLLNAGRKALVMVGTKDQAYLIMDELARQGLAHTAVILFGGNTRYVYDSTNGIVSTSDDVMHEFSRGKYQVIIGTSVLYEGTDLPNVDVVLLYAVGKQSRVVIQTIGRGLRSTKTGRYAYIIDFTDHECGVLRSHSHKRREMYLEVIGVQQQFIYDKITPETEELIFKSLEGIV